MLTVRLVDFSGFNSICRALKKRAHALTIIWDPLRSCKKKQIVSVPHGADGVAVKLETASLTVELTQKFVQNGDKGPPV